MFAALVTCIQLVPDEELQDGEDFDSSPAGEYTFCSGKPTKAEAYEDILDQFHSTIPIGCLEDFDVEVLFTGDLKPYDPGPV